MCYDATASFGSPSSEEDTATEAIAATAPKVTGAIRKLPPSELEIANFPQSKKATEVGTVPTLAARLTPLISLVYNKTRHKS